MKKKLIGLLKPLLSLLFMLLFVNSYTTCKAYSIDDYQLNDEIMEAIVNEIGLGNYFSGDYIPTLTNNFNLMMRTIRARGDYHQVTLGDCIFFRKSNTQFAVTFNRYRDSFIDSQDATLETQNHYFNVGSIQESSNGNISVLGFVNWIYDSNNNISNASTEGIKYWYFNYNGYGYLSTTSNTINALLYENDTYSLQVGNYVILDNSSFDNHPMRVYRYSSLTGYNQPFYENIIYLGNFNPIVTPTPIPTNGGGGGGTVIVNGGMTQEEFEQGQENYWGNENNIENNSGEQIIESGINEIMNSVSGELHSGEAINLIGTIEDGIKAIFHTEAQDFKIAWGTGYTLDTTTGLYVPMIESGEINFSELERENDTIAMIMTYVRTILNFIIILALAKSAWNLLMDYLGVPEAKEELGDATIAETVVEASRVYRGR